MKALKILKIICKKSGLSIDLIDKDTKRRYINTIKLLLLTNNITGFIGSSYILRKNSYFYVLGPLSYDFKFINYGEETFCYNYRINVNNL